MIKNVLITYYSHSGNTERIAKLIEKELCGDIVEIKPLVKYPVAYSEVTKQAKQEINSGYHPELETMHIDITKYDTVIVGTPNWWGTVAPPVASFLKNYDLSGKNVAVFCTHGGGGISNIERDFKAMCPNSDVKKSLEIYGAGNFQTKQDISKWLGELSN